MRGLFTLLTPRIKTFKNTWFGDTDEPLARGMRTGLVAAGFFFVPYLIYIGIQQSIHELEGATSTLPTILEVIHIMFLSVLFFSSCIHALNSLFMAKDNEMIVAAPLRPYQLFAGKLLETAFTASWVLLVFYIPAVWAVGTAFHASFFFYPYTLLYLIPLVIVPTSLSIVASILFVRLYPARRVRETLIVVSILVVLGLHFGLKGHDVVLQTIHTDLATSLEDDKAFLQRISSSFAEHTLIFMSRPLEIAAQDNRSLALQALAVSLLLAAAALIASYRCFTDLYLRIFSLDTLSGKRHRTRIRQKRTEKIPALSQVLRAFASKDFKQFIRDLAQPVQLILFVLMAGFAMMGFHSSASIAPDMRAKYIWWDALLMLTNMGFHIVVSVLFAGRFIFPSIAAEGEASWIIQCAPLEAREFFRAKLLVATIPSVGLLMTFLAISCIISDLPAFHLLVALSVGLLNTVCIAATAIGLGAYFSKMHYEHLGQITTGIGSVLSMFISLLVVPCNNIIAAALGILLEGATILPAWSILIASYLLLFVLHLLWMRYCLTKGLARWVMMAQ